MPIASLKPKSFLLILWPYLGVNEYTVMRHKHQLELKAKGSFPKGTKLGLRGTENTPIMVIMGTVTKEVWPHKGKIYNKGSISNEDFETYVKRNICPRLGPGRAVLGVVMVDQVTQRIWRRGTLARRPKRTLRILVDSLLCFLTLENMATPSGFSLEISKRFNEQWSGVQNAFKDSLWNKSSPLTRSWAQHWPQ